MIYGSLCSGIEAASVAWHPLGWKASFVSEIDKNASRVLAHHYPNVPNLGDMTKFQEWPEHAIDLLVGGTPCQSFSVAGLRKGLADPRGNLALVYLAIADRLKPRWIIWENVPGVLSSNGGRDFGAFLGGLGQLGYGWAYRVLDAQFVRVDGFGRAVPQRRRRVFVVGYLGDWRRAAAVLFERESLHGDSAPRREAGQGFAASVAPSLVSSGRGVERTGETRGQDPVIAVHAADVAPTLNAHFGEKQGLEDQHIRGGVDCSLPPAAMCLNAGGMGRQDAESETLIPTIGGGFDVAGTMKANNGGGGWSNSVDHAAAGYMVPVAHSLRGEGFDASEDGTGRGTPIVPTTYPINTQVGLRHNALGERTGLGIGSPDDPSFTLQAGHSHAVAFMAGQGAKAGSIAYSEEHSPTLRASESGTNQVPSIAQGWAVRRLTPEECEALQGFPRGYTDIRHGNKHTPDGPRYKQLGNSMAVNCMRWLGWRIEMVEAATASQPWRRG